MGNESAGIVVGVDFGPGAERVVAEAARLATALGGPVWLVHVAAPDPDFVGLEAGPQTVRDARAGELHAEHRELQEHAERLRESGVDTTALLVQGPTARTLVGEAERRNAAYMLVGSRGHGLIGKALLGSVGEGVLHRSPVPVVVVPSARKG